MMRIQNLVLFCKFVLKISVKGITSTSYFSALFKNTTFRVMERKFLCSGDVLDLADLTDKAKQPSQHLRKQIHEVLKSCQKHNR